MESEILAQLNHLRRKGATELEILLFLQEFDELISEARFLIPLLIEYIQSPNTLVRFKATTTVGKLGEEAHQVLPQLIQVLHDPKWLVRENAILTIRKIGCKSRGVVSALLEILKESTLSDIILNKEIILTLGQIKAQGAVPSLITILEDAQESLFIRQTAAMALGEIERFLQPESPLSQKFSQENFSLKLFYEAGYTLSPIDLNHKKSIPILLPLLQDKNWVVRQKVVKALGKFKSETRQIVPTLIEKLKNETEEEVCFEIKSTLRWIIDESEETINAFLQALQDSSSLVREVAASALGNIGHAGKLRGSANQVILTLMEAVTDRNPEVRTAAVIALGSIGSLAKEAIPILAHLLQEQTSQDSSGARDFRKHVIQTIKKIYCNS